ncbi:hypothetical protein D3C78_1433880 [compost metagenome]
MDLELLRWNCARMPFPQTILSLWLQLILPTRHCDHLNISLRCAQQCLLLVQLDAENMVSIMYCLQWLRAHES